jgi:hypothetical protein
MHPLGVALVLAVDGRPGCSPAATDRCRLTRAGLRLSAELAQALLEGEDPAGVLVQILVTHHTTPSRREHQHGAVLVQALTTGGIREIVEAGDERQPPRPPLDDADILAPRQRLPAPASE